MKYRYKLSVFLSLTVIIISILTFPAFAASENQIVLSSGATYTGEVVLNGVPNGTGVAIWPNGSKYTGEFFNGMPNGKGTFEYSNGDVYVGQFEYGFRSGKGVMTFSNGDTYDGEWKADMMHGLGKYTFITPDPANAKKNDVYTGQWRFNMMHGKGSYRLASGTTTKGYWVENNYRGKKLTNTIKAEIGELD
jgi:hypothetical protein